MIFASVGKIFEMVSFRLSNAKSILATLIVCMSVSAIAALPVEIEADRLILQAQKSFEAKDFNKAEESFAALEKLGTKLPVNFYYFYGYVLTQTGHNPSKAKELLERYLTVAGSKGKFYTEALDAYSKVNQAIENAQLAARKREEDIRKARETYDKDVAAWNERISKCLDNFDKTLDRMERDSLDALAACQRRGCDPNTDEKFVRTRKKFLFTRRDGAEPYCNDRYSKPSRPSILAN